MPKRKRLTDAGIAKLRAEEREYIAWDTGVSGLGMRVRSSGSRTFVCNCKTAGGVRKMSFGLAALRKYAAPVSRRQARKSRLASVVARRHRFSAISSPALGRRIVSTAASPRREGAATAP